MRPPPDEPGPRRRSGRRRRAGRAIWRSSVRRAISSAGARWTSATRAGSASRSSSTACSTDLLPLFDRLARRLAQALREQRRDQPLRAPGAAARRPRRRSRDRTATRREARGPRRRSRRPDWRTPGSAPRTSRAGGPHDRAPACATRRESARCPSRAARARRACCGRGRSRREPAPSAAGWPGSRAHLRQQHAFVRASTSRRAAGRPPPRSPAGRPRRVEPREHDVDLPRELRRQARRIVERAFGEQQRRRVLHRDRLRERHPTAASCRAARRATPSAW